MAKPAVFIYISKVNLGGPKEAVPPPALTNRLLSFTDTNQLPPYGGPKLPESKVNNEINHYVIK